jgi:hypothetical protein
MLITHAQRMTSPSSYPSLTQSPPASHFTGRPKSHPPPESDSPRVRHAGIENLHPVPVRSHPCPERMELGAPVRPRVTTRPTRRHLCASRRRRPKQHQRPAPEGLLHGRHRGARSREARRSKSGRFPGLLHDLPELRPPIPSADHSVPAAVAHLPNLQLPGEALLLHA